MLAWAGSATADPGPNVCHRLRNAIASGTPVSKLPPRLVRQCFGNHVPGRSNSRTGADGARSRPAGETRSTDPRRPLADAAGEHALPR